MLNMEFQHLNRPISVEEDNSFDWALFEDPFLSVPPLLSEPDALVQLPDGLDQFIEPPGFCSSDPFTEHNSHALVPFQGYSPLPLQNPLLDDDIDLDSFTWSDNLQLPSHFEGVISDAVPLNITPTAFSEQLTDGIDARGEPCQVPGCGGEGTGSDDGEIRAVKKRTSGRSMLSDMGFDEIKSYFCMPIIRAAREMNVGLTVLKKRCRELGIRRWPHRKMKSLKSLIRNVQDLGRGACEEAMRRELESLEQHRRIMEENPEIQLTERTKKLRQACFKANYKRRRALQQYPCVGPPQ